MFRRKSSFFPLVLGLLTLVLIGLVYMSFSEKKTRQPEKTQIQVPQERSPEVTDESYMDAVNNVFDGFFDSLEEAEKNVGKLVLVENKLDEVLGLKVSSGKRGLHLQITTHLLELRENLRSEDDRAYGENLQKLRELLTNRGILK